MYDHPTPVQFKYRLRKYVLGRNDEVLWESANVADHSIPNLTRGITLDPQQNEIDTSCADQSENPIITVEILGKLSGKGIIHTHEDLSDTVLL